jgi:hypothetical protein
LVLLRVAVAACGCPARARLVVFHFKIVDNGDGSRTYFVAADDIRRGICRARPYSDTGAGGAAASGLL